MEKEIQFLRRFSMKKYESHLEHYFHDCARPLSLSFISVYHVRNMLLIENAFSCSSAVSTAVACQEFVPRLLWILLFNT